MRVGDRRFYETPTRARANAIAVARGEIPVFATPARVTPRVYTLCRALAHGAKGDGDDQEAGCLADQDVWSGGRGGGHIPGSTALGTVVCVALDDDGGPDRAANPGPGNGPDGAPHAGPGPGTDSDARADPAQADDAPADPAQGDDASADPAQGDDACADIPGADPAKGDDTRADKPGTDDAQANAECDDAQCDDARADIAGADDAGCDDVCADIAGADDAGCDDARADVPGADHPGAGQRGVAYAELFGDTGPDPGENQSCSRLDHHQVRWRAR
jgi:hypothetical protein